MNKLRFIITFLSIFATMIYMCFNINDTIPYLSVNSSINFRCYEGKYKYLKDDLDFSDYIETEHNLAIVNIVFSILCLVVNILFFISLGNKRTSVAILILFWIIHITSIIIFFAGRDFPLINKCDYFCTSVKTCYAGICSKTKDGNYCENEIILKRQIPIICSFVFSSVLNFFAFNESQIPDIELPDKNLLEPKEKSDPILIETPNPVDNLTVQFTNPLEVI